MKRKPWLVKVLTNLGGIALDGWLLALLLGGLHSSYPQIPAVGVLWCMAGVAILAAIVRGVVMGEAN